VCNQFFLFPFTYVPVLCNQFFFPVNSILCVKRRRSFVLYVDVAAWKGLLCIPPLDGSAEAASGGESVTTAHRSPSVSVYAFYKALAVLET
jgi:hypothetical protein